MAFRGLRRQGFCPYTVKTDDLGNEIETYGRGRVTPKVMKFNSSATSETTTINGDDGVAEEEVSQGNGSLSIDLANLTLEDQADILGHKYVKEENHIVCNKDDKAPYCICSSIVPGVLNKKNYFRVTTFLRVGLAPVDDDYETKGQQVVFKGTSISGKFYPNRDGDWKDIKEFEKFEEALEYFDQMLHITEADELSVAGVQAVETAPKQEVAP